MKIKLGKKYIYITPTPTEDIKDGLWVQFDKEGTIVTREAYCDIVKGRNKYLIPEEPGRIVIKAWVINRFPCVESTIDIRVGNDEYRIWLDQKGNLNVDEDLLHKTYHAAKEIIALLASPKEKMRKIAILPNVSAVQHRIFIGNDAIGAVAYTVDFSSDVHG